VQIGKTYLASADPFPHALPLLFLTQNQSLQDLPLLSALGMGARDCLRDAAICSSAPMLHNPGPSKGQALESIKIGPNVGKDHQGWKRPLGLGPNYLMLTPPGQVPIYWNRESPDFLLDLAPSSERTEVVGKDAIVMGWVGPLLSGVLSAAAPLDQPLAEGTGRE